MASQLLTDFLRRLRGDGAVKALGQRTDAELLERFVALQEESAFAALVQRHGPMVLGVCRHLLPNSHDVEDAFQAVFLVLVSKAASIRRRTLLAGWLYRVAYRVAMRARVQSARRRGREVRGVEMITAQADAEGIDPELRPVLHEELNRLPEKYRSPIVLCYLQGKTHEEAARQLAWPIGTVKGRLARARELLRSRLTRRGLTLSTTAVAALLTPSLGAAAVPASLLNSTIKAALLIAAGQATITGLVSMQSASLFRGVLRTMFLTKLTTASAVLLGIAAIGASAVLFAYPKTAEVLVLPEASEPPAVQAIEKSPKPKEPDEGERKLILAARQRSANNLRGLMQALFRYHDVNDHFPPAAIYDKSGKPLLSWRVLLLPYFDEDDLFAQFHLDEPWDSKHNKPLLAKIPKMYAPPLPGRTKNKHATFYQVFAGKGAMFDGAGTSITDIKDGLVCTIAVVEAAEAVPWTKPADLPYDDKKPLPKLGGLFDNGINAVFADGCAMWIKKDFDVQVMRRAIELDDRFPSDIDKLKAKE